jgi:uncharacterized membrane protein YidH (DUF202 family)
MDAAAEASGAKERTRLAWRRTTLAASIAATLLQTRLKDASPGGPRAGPRRRRVLVRLLLVAPAHPAVSAGERAVGAAPAVAGLLVATIALIGLGALVALPG